jgi:phage terminase large subunit-like protein
VSGPTNQPAPAPSASLFERSVARLGARRVRELLRSVRVRQFAPDAPEEFADRTAADFADHLWPLIARPEQLSPPGDWSVFAYIAGRGAGKSRAAAQWVVSVAERAGRQIAEGRLTREQAKILCVAPTSADLRDVVVEGDGGLLRSSPPWMPPAYEPSKRRVGWSNGVEAVLISADEPDRIRGVQGIAAWGDECAVWPKLQEAFANLRFAVRLGDRPQICLTTTPRRRKELRDILSMPSVVVTRGRTRDNVRNLAPGVVDALEAQYGGSRLGRQELDGELLEDAVGALWRMDLIDAARVSVTPELRRVVVAIDPAGSSRPDSDETGIVTAGVGKCRCKGGEEEHGFVLADDSGRYSPEGWARAAVNAYERHKADRIVAEKNFGGDMVEQTLRSVDRNVSFEAVTASRGKAVRAEPIAALYELAKIHHIGSHARLEDQMCEWSPMTDSYSPDRVDALVWALTSLDLGARPYVSIFDAIHSDSDAPDSPLAAEIAAMWRRGR